MKNLVRTLVLVLATSPVLFLYNNCSNGFKTEGMLAGNGNLSSEGNGPSNPNPHPIPDPNPNLPPPAPAPINPNGKLNVLLDVKEVAGVGSTEYPLTAVVPLPQGAYQNTSNFRIADSQGKTLPAQFEILNRWWGKDNSLRNVIVHFQPTVSAFTASGTGIAQYYFKDDGGNAPPEKFVAVQVSDAEINIATGAAGFKIQKSPLKIITPAGELKAIFQGRNAGDVQESLARSDVKIEIEERGPMRAVVKLSSPTVFKDANNHRHGFAIRLYAYAGKPYLKVDYQLQNSDKSVKFSAALYFESLNLEIETGKTATPASVKADIVKADFSASPLGLISAPGVNAIIRNFYETWPNGLEVTSNGKLKVELWPSWSANYWEAQLSPTGLYWLEDMQHSYKEVLFDFSSRPQDQLTSLAKTFQYHPVATIPTSWYADTKATLDMGGSLPTKEKMAADDLRKPVYAATSYKSETDTKNLYRTYRFGWLNFGLDVERKIATSMTGGVPYYNASFLLTGNPSDYYAAVNFAAGEINIRPQWMEGYKFATDNTLLKLTENPYGGGVWRAFDGHGVPTMAVPYLEGTGRTANARDDEHGWFYPAEFGYAISGNLWVKDWYQFIAEFRKVRLNYKDPWPDRSSRAVGHAISHALQAYRVTGDPEIPLLVKNYLRTYLAQNLDPMTGINITFIDTANNNEKKEAPWQGAYMLRAFITYNEEISADDSEVLKLVKNYVDWNRTIGNYGYYVGVASTTTPASSNGGSDVFADIAAWYMLKTGDKSALEHLKAYYQTGIPAGTGSKAYNPAKPWAGHAFINRFVPLVYQQ